MSKIKLKNYVALFTFQFIFLLFFVFLIRTNISEEPLRVFLMTKMDLNIIDYQINMPLLFYMLFLILTYTSALYLYIYFRERKKLKKVEKALEMLNEGKYSASIFLKMFSEQNPVQVNSFIDHEILKLQEKMILISEEAVSSAQQISKITKESKEEIIEAERKRIARELHDSVSQQLFAAAMLLSAIEVSDTQFTIEFGEKIDLVKSIIEEAQSEMRALLLHLRPVKLDGKSLQTGIHQLLEELASKLPIQIDYEIEDIQLTEVVEDHLFRIVQELISNVLRHSEASRLEVYFKKSENFYRLRFIDDGKGFNMEEKKDSALGLSNVRERIERLGGNVHLVSIPKQGTSVEVRIPLTTGRIL